MQGIVTNIQRFSIHDGPGIRTTVFLKGCNLRCFWCHNPETLRPQPELQIFASRCIGCGECFRRCPQGAHVIVDGQRKFLREKCIACGTCQRVCPSGVIKIQGVKTHARSGKVATHYVIDYTRCSLCGLCVESCPTQTLKFSTEYELAGESRWDGVVDLVARMEDSRS